MENRSLANLTKDHAAIISLLLESDGEVNEVIEKWMEINQEGLADKVDQYRYVMDAMNMQLSAFKLRAAEFVAAAVTLESAVLRMKDRLKTAMQAMNTDELLGNEFRFKLAKNPPSVVIENEDNLPATFCKEKVVLSPDKVKIREALERGETIVGCSIQQGTSVRPYMNTKKIRDVKKVESE